MKTWVTGIFLGAALWGGVVLNTQALVNLTDTQINNAIKYGMENQDYGLSTFLSGNWREGTDGALLNIYTPFMQIARKVALRKPSHTLTAEKIAAQRKKMKGDIDYIWLHQNVKFMSSLYGDSATFGKDYFARIEGTGRGRNVTLYPTKFTQQGAADFDKDTKLKPYSAINAYYFNFEDIATLDTFDFILYGKDITPIKFRIKADDIQ